MSVMVLIMGTTKKWPVPWPSLGWGCNFEPFSWKLLWTKCNVYSACMLNAVQAISCWHCTIPRAIKRQLLFLQSILMNQDWWQEVEERKVWGTRVASGRWYDSYCVCLCLSMCVCICVFVCVFVCAGRGIHTRNRLALMAPWSWTSRFQNCKK